MKLLEKLKNTFFEEEYVEVPVKEEKKKEDVVAKKVEVKEESKPVIKYNIDIEEEEKPKKEKIEEKVEEIKEEPVVVKKNKIPYFEDDDFVEEVNVKKVSREEKHQKIYGQDYDYEKVKESYKIEQTSKEPYNAPVKGKFQPTPIISPIYGILDKNYRKEEVIDKKDKPSSYVSRRNADLDSIRKKAYGDVSIFGDNKVKETKEEIKDDPLLYDMIDDNSKPVVSQVTMADAEEYFQDLGLEYNVDYKDGKYEKATGRRTSSNKKIEKEDIDDDANLATNLFDLVDSVYEEGDE